MKRRRINSSLAKARQRKRGHGVSTHKLHGFMSALHCVVKHVLLWAKLLVEVLLLLQKLDWDKLMQMFKWWDE
ncbi:MAG: hypothetical protein E6Q92_02415 [Burkholderiaceae bacterium]|nr:MAG: hypothetical protein E6Q92_02415 [Burkholderiaceae bacterium]